MGGGELVRGCVLVDAVVVVVVVLVCWRLGELVRWQCGKKTTVSDAAERWASFLLVPAPLAVGPVNQNNVFLFS